MARSLTVIAASTAATSGAALAHAAVSLSTAQAAVPAHGRSAFYVLGTAAATFLWAGAIALTGSVSIAAAGGIVAGGAAANLASLALWPSVAGVPNPFVARGFAFNLADAAVVLGLAVVLVAVAVFAVRNRARLREPITLGR